ncbi:prepilin-type N-terminal cleavage/methylation domain-containing protein [Candidatus Gracilibacteria bacterium]|nr:prepilin-type N-terminal cleavage/methylation domain-containing protein [Candidatus Gracilibacteria bacterium]
MSTKKGFTLVELMLVVVLIGIFFTMTSYMTNNTRVYQTKAERFANDIYDTIRSARNNMIIGRGVLSGTTMVVTNERTITVTNTGLITTYKYNTTSAGTEKTLVSPYYDQDAQYKITDIAISSGGILNGNVPIWDRTGSTLSSVGIIINPNSQITMTGIGTPVIPSNSIRTIKITAGYAGFEQSIVIDRVSGTVETRKSSED